MDAELDTKSLSSTANNLKYLATPPPNSNLDPKCRHKIAATDSHTRNIFKICVEPKLPTYHHPLRIGARAAEGAGLLIRCTG